MNNNFQAQDVLPNSYATKLNDPKENCAALNTGIKVNLETNLRSDACLEDERTLQSVNASDYMLSNFRACDCNLGEIQGRASDNYGVTIKDGYGISGCTVDGDSKLRVGDFKSRPKCSQLLFTRPYATVPYMGRGSGNADVESMLKSSKQVHGVGHVSTKENEERTFNNHMTPLVKNLADNIQNPMNLVEEVNDPKWVHGGVPTRQIVKDLDYFARSKDTEEHKDYVMGKKAYMHYCL